MSKTPDVWAAALGTTATERWGEEPSARQAWQPENEIGTAHRVIAWTTAGLTLGYMLPWALAVQRNYPRHKSLAVANAALGWTGLGWILAMIEVLLWRPTTYWEQIGMDRTFRG